MFYYINTSSWNLLESFVSESLSPFSFYQERGYGNNLSRYINGANERANFLVLSTKEIEGDYVIKVNGDILDESDLFPVKKNKSLFTYGKTIYYKKGSVAFLFSSNDLLESLIADSQILCEVKCIEKYKSEFVINTGKNKPLITDNIANSISFQRLEYIAQDGIYDRLKGMIVAYTHAMVFAENPHERQLSCQLRDLKNSLAGLNTQVMISEGAVSNEDEYMSLIMKAKGEFDDIIRKRTNLFDILKQIFLEIVKLAKVRAEELLNNKQVSIESLENQVKVLKKSHHDDIYEELNFIMNQERENGIKRGKKREFFKKGTQEYNRKRYLKNEIKKYEEGKSKYKSIKQIVASIKQRISNIETGTSVYDKTLKALFVRVSDIMNEIIAKAKTQCKNNGQLSYSALSLTNSVVSMDVNASIEEKAFIDIIINDALNNENRVLSEDVLLNLIIKSANRFKHTEYSNTEKGKQILANLREFWMYKKNKCPSFSIPDNLLVLKSLMAFFIKPFGFDQMERYVQNKGIENKEYGYMLRGALIGYAAFPKTFTNALYANKDVYIPMDEYLTTIHKRVEAQYHCS